MHRLMFLFSLVACSVEGMSVVVAKPSSAIKTSPLIANLFQKPLFEIGSPCVYNAECGGCSIGYKQECVANNCHCTLLHFTNADSYGGFPSLKEPFGTNLACATHHLANAQLVYYDTGYQKCVVEKVKKPVRHPTCHEYHDIHLSLIDGFTYCLNALSPLDAFCIDNYMCHKIINRNKTLGLCLSGICHAVSTNNMEKLILNKPECNSTYTLSYCREQNYTLALVTHDRHARCAAGCMQRYYKSGIALASSNTCACFEKFTSPENIPSIEYPDEKYNQMLPK